MSNHPGDLDAARGSLLELARVVTSTRQTLAAMIQEIHRSGRLSVRSRPGQLSNTLEHLEHLREGFILSQRMPVRVSLTELQALLQHVWLDWGWLQALNLALEPGTRIESPHQQLIVYNHALVALGVLSRLPAEAITFPQPRPTYADLTAPVLPAELLERIEEIERVIYRAEVMPDQDLAYGSFRRTYAFFEASSWLVNRYLGPLLNK